MRPGFGPGRKVATKSSSIRRWGAGVVVQGFDERVVGQRRIVRQLTDHEATPLLGKFVHDVLGSDHTRNPPARLHGASGVGCQGCRELRGVFAFLGYADEPFPGQSYGLADAVGFLLWAFVM